MTKTTRILYAIPDAITWFVNFIYGLILWLFGFGMYEVILSYSRMNGDKEIIVFHSWE